MNEKENCLTQPLEVLRVLHPTAVKYHYNILFFFIKNLQKLRFYGNYL